MIILILYFFSFLLIWQFVGYPAIMAYIGLKIKLPEKNYSTESFISVIVATFNEESVIKRRIENLLHQNYPKNKYEIIVVDSGSSDNTVNIVKKLIVNKTNLNPSVKLVIENERRGKASALNLAKKYASGNILIIADANSIYDSNVLRELSPHFDNPEVGGVSGRYKVLNSDNNWAQQESFYWEIENLVFYGESIIDSVSTVVGTISAWRKELFNFSTSTMGEDFDMTLSVRSSGYRIRYEPKAIAYENAATSKKDQINQRKRTSIGTIQSIKKHAIQLLKPKNASFLVILFSHKLLTMLSPFILMGIPILYLLIGDIGTILIHILITGLTFSILLLLLMRIKSQYPREIKSKYQNDNTTNFRIWSIFKIIYYVLFNEYIILNAWKDLLFKKHDVLWEKAETTRI
jgi:cellulose synthase/poly-beta-1,6-N-acetylglucosamine synthase-like glycosyltransferase